LPGSSFKTENRGSSIIILIASAAVVILESLSLTASNYRFVSFSQKLPSFLVSVAFSYPSESTSMLQVNSIHFPRALHLLSLLAYDESIYPSKLFNKLNYVPGLFVWPRYPYSLLIILYPDLSTYTESCNLLRPAPYVFSAPYVFISPL
jgi:hypothetical protein